MSYVYEQRQPEVSLLSTLCCLQLEGCTSPVRIVLKIARGMFRSISTSPACPLLWHNYLQKSTLPRQNQGHHDVAHLSERGTPFTWVSSYLQQMKRWRSHYEKHELHLMPDGHSATLPEHHFLYNCLYLMSCRAILELPKYLELPFSSCPCCRAPPLCA